MGGIAIHKFHWHKARDLLNQEKAILAAQFNWGNFEWHCAHIRAGKAPFRDAALHDRINVLNNNSCAIIHKIKSESNSDDGVVSFGCIINKTEFFQSGQSNLYQYAFEQIVSRFETFLYNKNKLGKYMKGIIILDKNQSEQLIKDDMKRFQSDGTEFHDVRNILETPMFIHSHESPGLQLADIVTHAIWRFFECEDDAMIKKIIPVFQHKKENERHSIHGIRIQCADYKLHFKKLNRYMDIVA